MTVRVQSEDFDAGREIAALRRGNSKVGAVAAFVGVVRDMNDGSAVADMVLEHYPGMTEKAITSIIEQAKTRWNIFDVLVVHRGVLQESYSCNPTCERRITLGDAKDYFDATLSQTVTRTGSAQAAGK